VQYITRSEAKKQNLRRYITGIPCVNGHVTERVTINGSCVGCISERSKRKWAAGEVQRAVRRDETNKKWNASNKGRSSKQRWKEKDPKRAWCVSACGGAKKRAADKGLEFNLTYTYLLSICPDKCPVFNVDFMFIGNKQMNSISPSIDRLDPTKGYVEGNVVIVSLKANAIKNAYGSKDIYAVAEWLHNLGY